MSGKQTVCSSTQSLIVHFPLKVGFPLVMGLALSGLLPEQSISAEKPSAPPEVSTQPSSTEEAVSRIYKLGEFHIRQLRPTRGETINLKFELHLLMPEHGQAIELEKRLNHWLQRLRDQVITAVRNAESKDFTESGLVRLQQMMRLRINRLLKFTRIEEVYITRFEFVIL